MRKKCARIYYIYIIYSKHRGDNLRTVVIKPPYIKLGQLLKLLDFVAAGGEEKRFLSDHQVLVNNLPETRRGRKLYNGDQVAIDQQVYQVKSHED
jgi:ribosome-associated protein